MTDAIDDLERILAGRIGQDALPNLYAAIDEWRQYHGGNRAYIAQHSVDRRQTEIIRLADAGLKTAEIAERVGVSKSWVKKLTLRRSKYLN